MGPRPSYRRVGLSNLVAHSQGPCPPPPSISFLPPKTPSYSITNLIVIVRYHSGGFMKLMHVSCSSHTWFIYNLNTSFISCIHTLIWYIYTHRLAIEWSATPYWFPLPIPFYLLGIPPLVWCDPIHPGLGLLVNWPPPPHSLPIPSLFQFPDPLGFPQINCAPY
jgi:hypothetical protein